MTPSDWCSDTLDRLAADRPGDPAITRASRQWTYEELARLADTVAERLAGAGLVSGAWVRVEASPSPGAVVLLHAALRLGAAVTFRPPDPQDGGDPGFDVLSTAFTVRPDPRFEDDPGEGRLALEPGRGVEPPAGRGSAGPDVRAAVVTSGTEGEPRVVPVSARQLGAAADAVLERLPAQRVAWAFTLHPSRIGGLSIPFRALRAGGTVVCLDAGRWDAREALAMLRGDRVSHLSVAPVMLRDMLRLAEDEPGRVETAPTVLVGGAACPPGRVHTAAERGFRVATSWGMSETAAAICVAPPDLVSVDPATVGPPLRGMEVRTDDRGELHVRGPQVFGGYVGASESPLDGDGWYATGDVGSIDADGNVRVVGRRSRRIITGGVNVEPAAVEAVLRHHPDVLDVCVFGEADPVWGERVVAALVPAGPWSVTDAVETLEPWCRNRLTSARRPRRWVIARELPRTSAGKLDHRAVARRFRQPEREA